MALLKAGFRAIFCLIKLFALYLLTVALMPGLSVKPQPISPRKHTPAGDGETNRETVAFASNGSMVSA